MKSSQPFWELQSLMAQKPKLALLKMMEIARQLVGLGRWEEASQIARVLLRGFVSLAEQNRLESEKMMGIFLNFVEIFASIRVQASSVAGNDINNALIRLYNRILHIKQADCVNWADIEHVILRSCVMHGVTGGQASALADLQRKAKLWRMNASPEDYPVTVSEEETPGRKKRGVTETMVAQRQSAIIADWTRELAKVAR